MRRRSFLGAAVLTTAAVMILGVLPAGATVVQRGTYTNEPYSFEYDDCGFLVEVAGTQTGHFRIRAGKGKVDTAFFANDNYSYVETHTNPETGEFFTAKGNAVFNEIKARRVEGHHLRVRGGRGRAAVSLVRR